jgi:hypothetical protein
MHEYIRETSSWKYEICKCCDYRTSFTCIRCKYCWSCHWKKERLEGNELFRERIVPYEKQRRASGEATNSKLVTGVSRLRLKQEKMGIVKQQSPPTKAMINVFGEEEPDPICNYLNCNHAFSLHKDRKNHCKGAACNCRHPQNSVIGLR